MAVRSKKTDEKPVEHHHKSVEPAQAQHEVHAKHSNKNWLGFKAQWEIFAGSWKNINGDYSWVILFNLLFFIAAYGLVFAWSFLINRFANSIGLPADYSTLPPAQLASYTGQMQQLYSFIVSSAVVLVLLIILFWTLFEGLGWLTLYKNKMSWKIYGDFLGFNFLWFVVWSIPLMGILAYSTKYYNPAVGIYGTAIWAIIALYFTIIAYTRFFEAAGHTKLWDVFKDAFMTGFKIHYLIFPVCFCAVILILLSGFDWAISHLPKMVYQVISLIVVLFIYTWFRFYAKAVAEKV